jgi:hypothetical protein
MNRIAWCTNGGETFFWCNDGNARIPERVERPNWKHTIERSCVLRGGSGKGERERGEEKSLLRTKRPTRMGR